MPFQGMTRFHKRKVVRAICSMEMSICMLLTIAAIVCTLIGCAFLLCCIRMSTERENRRHQNLACTVEIESNVSSTTPMLPTKTNNNACDGAEV